MERHRWEADKLSINTNIDDQFMVVVVEAECTQAEWMGRAVMRLASQVLVMEVEEVEQAVAPAVETRGGLSSEAVSVASSTCKVTSDTVSLSNWANGLPEGSGTGQGGRGGRVHHCQAEGLSAGGMAGRHRRCMRRLQEGGGCSRVRIQDRRGLRPMHSAAWRKGSMGRASPPKQRGAQQQQRSSLRRQKVSRPSQSSPP